MSSLLHLNLVEIASDHVVPIYHLLAQINYLLPNTTARHVMSTLPNTSARHVLSLFASVRGNIIAKS
jgi:hypothetical protein